MKENLTVCKCLYKNYRAGKTILFYIVVNSEERYASFCKFANFFKKIFALKWWNDNFFFHFGHVINQGFALDVLGKLFPWLL